MQNLKGLKLEKAQFPTKILRCLRLLGHHHLTLQLASLLAREGEGEANLVQKDSFQDAHSHSPRAGLLTGRPGVCGGCFFDAYGGICSRIKSHFFRGMTYQEGRAQSCRAVRLARFRLHRRAASRNKHLKEELLSKFAPQRWILRARLAERGGGLAMLCHRVTSLLKRAAHLC